MNDSGARAGRNPAAWSGIFGGIMEFHLIVSLMILVRQTERKAVQMLSGRSCPRACRAFALGVFQTLPRQPRATRKHNA